MACCDCRYFKLNADVYPCSECVDNDMFIEDDGSAIGKDMLMVITELHQIKKAILELTKEIKENG